jgi:hypothetical protein
MVNQTSGLQGSGTKRAAGAWVIAVAACLLAACGGGDDEVASEAAVSPKAAENTAVAKEAADTATVKQADSKPTHLATAVPNSKTTAPIDLQYDIPAKPEVGQPFTIELVVSPRKPGDMLDVEVGDSPGLTIEGERVARFLAVEAGQPYAQKVQVRGNAAGLYYVSVITKLSSKVQSEGRAFSVPVVIGTPPAAQKPAPVKDATGQAIESMPAREQ